MLQINDTTRDIRLQQRVLGRKAGLKSFFEFKKEKDHRHGESSGLKASLKIQTLSWVFLKGMLEL
jgi:hypothetical protein